MDRERLVSAETENRPGNAGNPGGRRREVVVLIGTFSLSFVAFSLVFGSWKFGLGFVLLLLVHELGHVFEARRQGVHVTLPTFIPFFGAFVMVRQSGLAPWRSALVSLAGPFFGGLGAAAVWAVGSASDTTWLVQLAYVGFLLNAANLLPVGFLDGGAIFRAIPATWSRPGIRYENGVPVEAYAPERSRAVEIAVLYGLLALALVAGFLATRHV
jgi:Zn-dependent protease